MASDEILQNKIYYNWTKANRQINASKIQDRHDTPVVSGSKFPNVPWNGVFAPISRGVTFAWEKHTAPSSWY